MDIRFRSIKGMNDILPDSSWRWILLENRLRRHFFMAGFKEIRTPILEYAELFIRGIGEGTDIVDKEMYNFRDKDEQMVTLRPEGTASVVRAVVENNLLQQDPVQRLFYLGPMFRYERPQKGRLRQFHQFGAEIFGIVDGSIDAELIYLGYSLLCSLEINKNDFVIKINSLGCANCRKSFRARLVDFLNSKRDSLCEDCKRRIDTNPLRVLDCKNENCRMVTSDAPRVLDFLCEECSGHFQQVRSSLNKFGVEYEVDHRLVRGLDYYSRTTFEIQVINNSLGSQNTVIAGGRYDSLFRDFIEKDYPAIGFAGGIERLMEIIGRGVLKEEEIYKVSFISSAQYIERDDIEIVERLRSEGIVVEMDISDKSFKAKFKRADRFGAHLAIIKGEDESSGGYYSLKDLRVAIGSSDKQFKVPKGELVKEIINRRRGL